jgi:hypothetical protein
LKPQISAKLGSNFVGISILSKVEKMTCVKTLFAAPQTTDLSNFMMV